MSVFRLYLPDLSVICKNPVYLLFHIGQLCIDAGTQPLGNLFFHLPHPLPKSFIQIFTVLMRSISIQLFTGAMPGNLQGIAAKLRQYGSPFSFR